MQNYMMCINAFKKTGKYSDFSTMGELLVPISKNVNPKKNYAPKLILELFKEVNSFNQDEKKSRIELKKTLEKLDNRIDIFSKLMESYLYLDQGNIAKSHKIWKTIISKELLSFGFNTHITKNYRSEILTYSIELLKKIYEKVPNDRYFSALLIYLADNTNGEFKKRLEDSFDVILNYDEVLMLSQSVNFGHGFPNIWFPLLRNKSTMIVAENYLKESLFYKDLSSKKIDSLFLIEKYFPKNMVERDIIWNAFLELENKNDSYYRDLKFRILDQDQVRNYFMKKKKKYIRPNFSQKRNHYRLLLKEGIAVEYALFQLIKLGDYSPSYLFYLQGE